MERWLEVHPQWGLARRLVPALRHSLVSGSVAGLPNKKQMPNQSVHPNFLIGAPHWWYDSFSGLLSIEANMLAERRWTTQYKYRDDLGPLLHALPFVNSLVYGKRPGTVYFTF